MYVIVEGYEAVERVFPSLCCYAIAWERDSEIDAAIVTVHYEKDLPGDTLESVISKYPARNAVVIRGNNITVINDSRPVAAYYMEIEYADIMRAAALCWLSERDSYYIKYRSVYDSSPEDLAKYAWFADDDMSTKSADEHLEVVDDIRFMHDCVTYALRVSPNHGFALEYRTAHTLAYDLVMFDEKMKGMQSLIERLRIGGVDVSKLI